MMPWPIIPGYQAARSPKPGGRHMFGRATQNRCGTRLFSRLTQQPARTVLAGYSNPLNLAGYEPPGSITVLQTASRLGGSAVGPTNRVDHHQHCVSDRARERPQWSIEHAC